MAMKSVSGERGEMGNRAMRSVSGEPGERGK